MRSEWLYKNLFNFSKKIQSLPVLNTITKTGKTLLLPFFPLTGEIKTLARLEKGATGYLTSNLDDTVAEIFKGLSPSEKGLVSYVTYYGWDKKAIQEGLGINKDILKETTIGKVSKASEQLVKKFGDFYEGLSDAGFTVEEVEKYLPRRYKNMITTFMRGVGQPIKGLPPFMKKRTLKIGLLEATKRGYEPELDAASLLRSYGAAYHQLMGRKNLVEKAYELVGMPFKGTVPKGMSSYDTPMLKFKALFDKDVAEGLERVESFFTSDPAINKFIALYDRVLGAWKGFATAVNPGFHGRNFYSDFFMQQIADINSLKWIPPAGNTVIFNKIPVGKAGKYTIAQAWDEFMKHGGLGRGFIGGEFLPGEIRRLETMTSKYMGGRGILPSPRAIGQEVGMKRENTMRFATFLGSLDKGMSLDDAYLNVLKYHFDYTELTNFERKVMKRVVPFYTWLRKNIPLQFISMAEQPGKYTMLKHMKDAFETQSPPLTKTQREFLPQWVEELWGIQVPPSVAKVALAATNPIRQLFGIKDISPNSPYFFNPNLAFQDINRAFDHWDLLSSVTPLLKTPAELIFNRSFFFRGRQIEAYPGALVRAGGYAKVVPDRLKKSLGFVKVKGEWKIRAGVINALQSLNPWLANIGRAIDLGNPRWADQLTSSMVGIKFIPITGQMTRGEMYEQQRLLTEAQRYKQARGQMPRKGEELEFLLKRLRK